MRILVIMFVFFAGFSFSQDKIFEAKVANPKQFQESKTSGEFKFIFPKETKKETLEKNAAFYTQYFTMQFDEAKHVVTLKMLTNDSKSRQIINRFMISNKITQIEMDGVLYKVDEFYQKQMK